MDEAELLKAEIWLANRLKRHHVTDMFAGDTNFAIRKERLRQILKDHNLEMVIAGKNKEGKPLNYGDCFKKIWQEPL